MTIVGIYEVLLAILCLNARNNILSITYTQKNFFCMEIETYLPEGYLEFSISAKLHSA